MTDKDDKLESSDIGREIKRAEADIARARESVSESIVALEREISRALDGREWVRRQPILAVAGAFAVGVVLGCLVPRRARRR
jgi:ElaB/YqjD/DUF883 family membrane-anchored ribosome-binding protein